MTLGFKNHFYHSESTFEIGSLCNSIVPHIWHLVIQDFLSGHHNCFSFDETETRFPLNASSLEPLQSHHHFGLPCISKARSWPEVEPATLTTADPSQVVERQIWDDQGKEMQNRSGKAKDKRPDRRARRLWQPLIPAKWLKDTCGKSIERERQRQYEGQKQRQRYLYVPCNGELVLFFSRIKNFQKISLVLFSIRVTSFKKQ